MNNPLIEILKIKNFQKIWGSQIFSQVTLQMINFIIIINIFERTHSTTSVSLVWIFYSLPAIILGPFSGALVDMISRKKTLIITTLLNSVVVLGFLLIGNKIYAVYAIIFLYSIINQLYFPAEAATLPSIVSKTLLPAANTIFLFTQYSAFLIGFGLSGPLLRIAGPKIPFLITSILLILASLLVSRLPNDKILKINTKRFLMVIGKLREGYHYISQHRNILAPLLILISVQVVISLFTVILPSYAVDVLRIDIRDAGPLLIIPLALGTIGGAILVNRLAGNWRKRKMITYGAFISSFSLIILAIIVGFFHEVTILASLIMMLLGAGAVMFIIPTQTFLQEQTPENFRARVFGTLGFLVILGSLPPVLFAGAIADLIGVGYILLLVAIGAFGFGYYVFNKNDQF
ncbi:hypothetical protein COT44_04500 [Candidatus Shapirobacteria bacterium CG08_land_8_20_14_0_20_39_18]|uniref:Major facilitator superfamily (MFS) profile domain-containing protein n=1 Tax=Candidatus Shapirobacteria bacterium CG08_land_8_20_14_0_20_39_18 TaxID=1974883 RepID=A0A2M6XBW8_9BACT|nr:MAG: hypothetical protein COT44_04500 [Candidatus Shapirobacteria bacterium CG08_land_8_20_14_0_20_39_18]PIY65318.1 MAG: hypothetical protein COY91_02790 [Candidatus Shapirobacteria bacterium CG_4_10_14_0_8_um_filter_39_15]PJE68471.1 MAG: hypothetical protein COU94_01590 [Candidatus Shapirobacteria bacterium CG10_big_fil_rev_8_21_14_0_10_38_8]